MFEEDIHNKIAKYLQEEFEKSFMSSMTTSNVSSSKPTTLTVENLLSVIKLLRKPIMPIIFQNPGEADVLALTTFGVNVKESENPIGFFGTGFKYAIAVLLRTGHDITLLCGEEEYVFYARKETIRGQEFSLVYMNNNVGEAERLGFTTELGKNWEVWMAYRELYCNAKDENGWTCEEDNPVGSAGKTKVVVVGEGIYNSHLRRAEFILESEPLFTNPHEGVEIHQGVSNSVFYRGIKILEVPNGRSTKFTYNLKRQLDLTEDRLAKYPWMVEAQLRNAIVTCEDVDVAKETLIAEAGFFEHHFKYNDSSETPAAGFLGAISNLAEANFGSLNNSAYALYKKTTAANLVPTQLQLSPLHSNVLSRAVQFCLALGFQVDNYQIKPVLELGDGVLALAAQNIICVSKACLELGTRKTAHALIEEYVHLHTGFGDMTRELQTWLFMKVVSLGEQVTGEPL